VGVRDRLRSLGVTLPAVPQMPAGVATTFSWVRVHGDRVLVSGHPPQNPDGSPVGPFGRVPDQVSLEQAQQSARLAALAVIASLQDAVGDLDRIDAWLSVTGFVQAQPGYAQTTAVLNSFSEVILDVFGASAGAQAHRDRRRRPALESARCRRCGATSRSVLRSARSRTLDEHSSRPLRTRITRQCFPPQPVTPGSLSRFCNARPDGGRSRPSTGPALSWVLLTVRPGKDQVGGLALAVKGGDGGLG
jgi:enamine deaminase RidA (YjgF/YER057c/UK114 family)